MTESICLHIQDRDSGPIRVVELPWISVRIGRAAHCEVRLTEPDLPEEALPLAAQGAVVAAPAWHERRSRFPRRSADWAARARCLLTFPFARAGYCFTLRHDRSAEPDWELYAGPAPPRVDESEEPPVAEAEPRAAASSRRPSPQERLCRRRRSGYRQNGRSWTSGGSRSTWDTKPPGSSRAMGDALEGTGRSGQGRAESNQKTPEVRRPSYQSDLEPIPVREAACPLVQPLPSSFGPGLTPVSTPGAANAWTEPALGSYRGRARPA